jgi:hypothetical protein
MSSNSRRAAGTQTFTDVLKVWSGIKKPNPAHDVADFSAGVTLEVSCFLRPLSEPKARLLQGSLNLTLGEPVTWQRWRSKDVVTLDPPLTLADCDEKAAQPQVSWYTLVSASGSFRVRIPILDVELVRYAFAAEAT